MIPGIANVDLFLIYKGRKGGRKKEKGKKEGLFINVGRQLCCFNWEINGLTAEPRTRIDPLAFPWTTEPVRD